MPDPASQPPAGDPTQPEAEVAAPPTPVRRTPDQTSDDTDAGWGERADRAAQDRWLEEQRPPHWE